MNHPYIAVLALSLAAFASNAALAGEQATPKTRQQVLAEQAEALRSGDIVDALGKKLNEVNPGLYARPSLGAPKTREQVNAELAEALRTGDIVSNDQAGMNANDLSPNAYPAKPVAQGKTREQVKAELAEARRTGTLPAVSDA